MNKEHWTNIELSKVVEELGVVSEFDYVWARSLKKEDWYLDRKNPNMSTVFEQKYTAQAFHFSDILLPGNAKKIFGESWSHDDYDINFLCAVQCMEDEYACLGDWQEWLLKEVNKAL